MFMKNFVIKYLSIACILSLTACSSGSDVSTTAAGGGRGGTEYGFITLSITDAPIDYATEVWVQFNGVEFMPSSESHNQTPILVMLDSPLTINLLELQGNKSKTLLTNEILPTGLYDWVSLKVSAVKDGVMDSYIVLDDGTVHELDMPADSEIGLTIVGGLEVIANTPSAKTIDFDLRKSIVMTSLNDFKIMPVLYLVDDDESGAIEGTIRLKELISSNCSDFNPVTGNAVYLFKDFNASVDDIDGNGAEPFASALVEYDHAASGGLGGFAYSFGFIPYGQYTAVFTCEADLDDPTSDDVIRFSSTRNINVTSTAVMTLGSNTFKFKKEK